MQVIAFDQKDPPFELALTREFGDLPNRPLPGSSAGCALPAKMNSTGRCASARISRSQSRSLNSSAARL